MSKSFLTKESLLAKPALIANINKFLLSRSVGETKALSSSGICDAWTKPTARAVVSSGFWTATCANCLDILPIPGTITLRALLPAVLNASWILATIELEKSIPLAYSCAPAVVLLTLAIASRRSGGGIGSGGGVGSGGGIGSGGVGSGGTSSYSDGGVGGSGGISSNSC